MKNITHGCSKERLYKIYMNVKYRCSNEKDRKFKYYGGKGIIICKEWENDFIKFKEWALENGYEDGLTLDRKDSAKNYEPLNCRWVSRKIQSRNTKKIYKNNTSGYRGVSYNKINKKYSVHIRVDGKKKYLGYFEKAIDGAIAYDKYIIENNLEHTMNGV